MQSITRTKTNKMTNETEPWGRGTPGAGLPEGWGFVVAEQSAASAADGVVARTRFSNHLPNVAAFLLSTSLPEKLRPYLNCDYRRISGFQHFGRHSQIYCYLLPRRRINSC
ncbi:hypothetical protein Zmor_025864 [Zophobas morio]|uniref:Uncharacterized protein n=1 Tax=Zophobas morio TaxID=2755281 RepID=A0AA38HUA7_9CUCU|nr:hypothetical protein Zmor_025864 [Zophobas morio]